MYTDCHFTPIVFYSPRVSFRVGRTAVVRRHRTKRPVRTSSPVPLRALTYLITKELVCLLLKAYIHCVFNHCINSYVQKRSDSLYGVMLENHELKSENKMLKRKLKHRNKQVKLLSLDMLHHREVMKQHKEKIQMQMSQTENIQIQLQGLSLAVQDWETEQQRASKIKKEWN